MTTVDLLNFVHEIKTGLNSDETPEPLTNKINKFKKDNDGQVAPANAITKLKSLLEDYSHWKDGGEHIYSEFTEYIFDK